MASSEVTVVAPSGETPSGRSNLPPFSAPFHLAIIMDGNNRWAKAKGLPGSEGHREGARALKATVKNCVELNIAALTVFAFSSENWQRPQQEVELLMQLFLEALDSEVAELHENGVKITFIGDLSAFSQQIRQRMVAATDLTQSNARLTLNIAVNYGGRWDICHAARTVAEQVRQGQLQPGQIDEQSFSQYLALSDQIPVDLCIRTSGETRISNFLLWQLAYAELYFSPCLWPDFDRHQLQCALADFSKRQRRFGLSSEQVPCHSSEEC